MQRLCHNKQPLRFRFNPGMSCAESTQITPSPLTIFRKVTLDCGDTELYSAIQMFTANAAEIGPVRR